MIIQIAYIVFVVVMTGLYILLTTNLYKKTKNDIQQLRTYIFKTKTEDLLRELKLIKIMSEQKEKEEENGKSVKTERRRVSRTKKSDTTKKKKNR